jgi:hypothetical protein
VAVHKDTGFFDVLFVDSKVSGKVLKLPATDILKKGESPEKDSRPNFSGPQLIKFKIGDQVEALRDNKGFWKFGVIAGVDSTGKSVDVIFSDQYRENNIAISRVRTLPGSTTKVSSYVPFSVGMPVEARYQGIDSFLPAVILKLDRSRETVDLLYENGVSEENVPFNLARKRAHNPQPPRSPRLKKDMKIKANYRGKGKYYSGTIHRDNGDGTFDINYDDGENELRVTIEMIRTLEPSPRKTVRIEEFPVGSKVEADYRGKGKYFPAEVKLVHEDGTCDLSFFEDFEQESKVSTERIRKIKMLTSPADKQICAVKVTYQVGDKVEGNYRGRGRFYPARIKGVREDGTFDVDYEDGESELRVEAVNLRILVTDPSKAEQSIKFSIGTKVEANYRGKGRYYPGRIARVREDGTYDVDYDDGECEGRVKAGLIKTVGDSEASEKTKETGTLPTSSVSEELTVTHESASHDASFVDDLSFFDDLEHKKSLPPDKDGFTPEKSSAVKTLYQVGDKVEGNYRGRGRFYPARIKGVREDGTFDVDYEDGESELRVEAVNLRISVTDPSKAEQSIKFSIGTKVEANYRGKGRYYPGRIARVREDGTYDVDYDDGECEGRVKASSLVLSAPPSVVRDAVVSSVLADEVYAVGSKVEANYHGKGKYFPAMIERVHEGGTYDLSFFETFAQEKLVPAYLIRKVKPLRTSSPPPAVTLVQPPPEPLYGIGLTVETKSSGRVGKILSSSVKDFQVFYNVQFSEDVKEDDIPENELQLPKFVDIKEPAGVKKPYSRAIVSSAKDSPLKNRRVKEGNYPRSNISSATPKDNKSNKGGHHLVLKDGKGSKTSSTVPSSDGATPISKVSLVSGNTSQKFKNMAHAADDSETEKETSVLDYFKHSVPLRPFSLVEMKDFRSSNNKWVKGRIIGLDSNTGVANIRLLSNDEIVENVAFEELRLLRVTNSVLNGNGEMLSNRSPASRTRDANPETPAFRGNFESDTSTVLSLSPTRNRRNERHILNETFAGDLLDTMELSFDGVERSRSANGRNYSRRPVTASDVRNIHHLAEPLTLQLDVEKVKSSNYELQDIVSNLNAKLSLVLNELLTMRKREEIYLDEIDNLKSINEKLLQKLT